MNLQDRIQNCVACPLSKMMNTTPIPPEWRGQPEVMFIVDNTITEEHDIEQRPIAGSKRTRFIQIIESYLDDWYVTALIKCKPVNLTYPIGDIRFCKSTWIDHEIETVKPKIVVGCGTKVSKFVNCNHTTLSVTKIVESKRNEVVFEKILEEIKCQLTTINSQ